MKFKDFQAPVLFSTTCKALNLGEKIQVLSRMRRNPVLPHCIMWQRLVFIIERGITCFLCAMCAFKVRHHPHPLGTFVPTFVSFAASIAKLARGEKLRSQSLTHSPSVFDASRTKVLRNKFTISIHSNDCIYGNCISPKNNDCQERRSSVIGG